MLFHVRFPPFSLLAQAPRGLRAVTCHKEVTKGGDVPPSSPSGFVAGPDPPHFAPPSIPGGAPISPSSEPSPTSRRPRAPTTSPRLQRPRPRELYGFVPPIVWSYYMKGYHPWCLYVATFQLDLLIFSCDFPSRWSIVFRGFSTSPF